MPPGVASVVRKSAAGRGKARPIKVVGADEGMGMTESQAKRFLAESRSVIKLGTMDASGEPNVHPVWYCFEPRDLGLYALVGSSTKKLENIRRTGMVYFLVDQDFWPYRGVRGKGKAEVLPVGEEAVAIVDRMLARYIKKDHPMHAYFTDSTREGRYVVVKIIPRYFSTWDYGRMDRASLSAGLDWKGGTRRR
jgi:nitroimidazol reductase NimA-like FMN-containing flavoprotein (pyridoxamine 5'-phosphate oxidase superfamily)